MFWAFVRMRRCVCNFDSRQRIQGGTAHRSEGYIGNVPVHLHLSPHFLHQVIDPTIREPLLLRSLVDDVVDESAGGASRTSPATLNLLLS